MMCDGLLAEARCEEEHNSHFTILKSPGEECRRRGSGLAAKISVSYR